MQTNKDVSPHDVNIYTFLSYLRMTQLLMKRVNIPYLKIYLGMKTSVHCSYRLSTSGMKTKTPAKKGHWHCSPTSHLSLAFAIITYQEYVQMKNHWVCSVQLSEQYFCTRLSTIFCYNV